MNSAFTQQQSSSTSPSLSLPPQAVGLQDRIASERARRRERQSVVEWASAHFYIEDAEAPIVLAPHQKGVLRYCLTRNADDRLPFKTIIWSEPKKGGKTTVAGMAARWAAETWGRFGEILCVGNDVDQARERGFAKLKQSIELTPGYNRSRETLPGRWKLTSKEAVCLTTGTRVKAIATDYQGEAGANPILSVWCVPTQTPILRADLTWCSAQDYKPGDKVVSFEEFPAKPNVSRKFVTGTVTHNEIRTLPCMEIQFVGGSPPLRATPEHQWLVRRRGQNVVSWKRTDELDANDELGQIFPLWKAPDTWDAGYIAGALDGEGHLSVNSKPRMAAAYNLGVSQLKGKYLLEKIAEIWARDGIYFSRCEEPGSPKIGRLRVDQKVSVVRVLGMYRPMRLLSKFSPDHLGHLRAYSWHRVASVESREPEPMACISTDVKTYIANGYAAHNTELWGYIHKADLRFWAEMAPSPTRPDSIRWVESYAGFEGESELLYGLYESAVKNGRQLTAGELGDQSAFVEAPNPDSLVPCYVNEAAGIFAYWDEGDVARRQPWQQGERGADYYANEAATQTPSQYTRIHLNRWVSAESSFIAIEWWDNAPPAPAPLIVGDKTPVVVALDAAVSGDCFGLVGVTRDPDQQAGQPLNVVLRFVRKWDPPQGGKIDYAGPEAAVRELCRDYNVVQVAYDPYQLHDLATRLQQQHVAWFRPFTQGEQRLKADKGLWDMIVGRRVRHSGHPDLRDHLTNANAKQQTNEDSKLRIVKKAESRKIDLVVCLSMAAAECLRLNL